MKEPKATRVVRDDGRVYASAAEAAAEAYGTEQSIRKACRGSSKTAYGHRWRYLGAAPAARCGRRVVMDGSERFASAEECAAAIGATGDYVRKRCGDGQPCKGHLVEWEDGR